MHGLPPNALVEKHLWIVDKFAATYQKAAPHADLKAAGALGLVEAAQRFKPRKGAAFSTYAWNWVKGHVLSELRRAHVVPVPEHTARAAHKAGRAVHKVVVHFGGRDENHFDDITAQPQRDGGLDGERRADRSMQRRAVRDALGELDRPELRHVVSRTLAGRSVEQIADGMGVAVGRVEELLDEARAELAWMLE